MVGDRLMPVAVNLAIVLLLSSSGVQAQTCPVENLDFTSSDALGPFFIANSPVRDRIAPEDQLATPSNVLTVEGHIYGSDCRPMAGAILEPWYAGEPDENGDQYSVVGSDLDYRGQVETDECGFYSYVQTYPDVYAARPIRHVHYRVSHQARQLLVTQMYFEGDIPPFFSPDVSQVVSSKINGDGSRHVVFDIFVNTPGTSTSDCDGSKSPSFSGTTTMSPSTTNSDSFPTLTPSMLPTNVTSDAPSMTSTNVPSAASSPMHTDDPTDAPTNAPSPADDPSDAPSMTPAVAPSSSPNLEVVSSASSQAFSHCWILLLGLLA